MCLVWEKTLYHQAVWTIRVRAPWDHGSVIGATGPLAAGYPLCLDPTQPRGGHSSLCMPGRPLSVIRWHSQVVTAPMACWPRGLSMREKARLVRRAKKHHPFSHFQTIGLRFLKKQKQQNNTTWTSMPGCFLS